MPGAPPSPGVVPGRAGAASAIRGLAELAFGSVTRYDDPSGSVHLGLLPTQMLELDLGDPAQRRFGDYELEQQIGEGGMGVVYRARQRSLERKVAVKLLAAGPWASKDFIARFEREAQNAARMQHPNIVTVYEVGSVDGLHFFSMRLVEGESLSARLKAGQRPGPRESARLLRIVAEATAYAHSLGVLHLDLKPGNVLLDEAGVPYITDFGLARRLENALAIENEEISGTPAYMAPEQARVRSQRLTAATDIWGLGAILYELLTGQPPFRAETAQATVRLVLEGSVRPPRRLQASVPMDLQAIVLRCLARDPSERYPSARALADDLARFAEGRPVLARPLNMMQRTVRWTRREPRLAATAAGAVAILVAGLFVSLGQWHRADRNAAIASSNAANARANAATANNRLWDSRNDAALRLMEDGQDWEAAPLLLANLTEMEAAGDAGRAAGVRKRLGIVRNNNPALIDTLHAQRNPVAIAFDAAGTRIATSGTESGVRLFATANGRELLRVPGQPHEVWTRLHFAPDDRVLLAQRMERSDQSPRPAGAEMRRLDATTGRWLAPPAPFAEASAQSYSPDGRYAVLTLKDGRAQAWAVDPWRPLGPAGKLAWSDGEHARLIAPNGKFFALNGPDGSVTLVGTADLAATRVPLGDFGHLASWALSPDSRWLAAGDSEGHVVAIDTATRAVRPLAPQAVFGARWLAFSSDGHWLALAAGAGGVYLWSWPDGKLLVPPFSGNASPGGAPLAEYVGVDRRRNLVFVTDYTRNTAVWQVAPAGLAEDRSEARRVMAGLDNYLAWGVEAAAWQPDAGLLATAVTGRVKLLRLHPPTVKAGRAAPIRPETLRFDGERVVAVAGQTLQTVDAVTGRPLGAAIGLPQAPGFAELTPDGATLVATSGRELRAFDARTGKPRFTPIALDNSPGRVELSPDGKRVAIAWPFSDPRADRSTSNVVVIHDLADGRRLGGPVALPGPGPDALAFSADGTRILAWNRREVVLRDGTSLAPVPGPFANFRPRGRDANARHGYVRNAAIDGANGVELVLVWHDGTQWLRELRRYRPDGTFVAARLAHGAVDTQDLLPLPAGRGTVLATNGDPYTLVVAPDGTGRQLPDDGDDSFANNQVAVSRDGRWLARTRRDGVALFDLERQVRVATLRAALARPDAVLQLAFSPDGGRLLGRSVRNRYLVWELAPDLRPAGAIADEQRLRELAGTAAAAGTGAAERDAGARERAALRAADPGPPAAPGEPHSIAAVRWLPGGAVPPRAPGTPPELLDLTPYYTFGFAEPFSAPPYRTGDFAWLAAGIQRFQGVDYDLRGGVRLDAARPPTFDFSGPHRRFIAAIDALVVDDFEGAGDVAAVVRFEYADGTVVHAPLAITDRAGEYWSTPGGREAARVAAAGTDARTWQRDLDPGRVYLWTIHAANPHPERAVRRLVVNPAAGSATTAGILGLTLEPIRRVTAEAVP